MLGDGVGSYEAVPTDGGWDAALPAGTAADSPTLVFRSSEGGAIDESEVERFSLVRTVQPKSALVGDFDFRHPSLMLRDAHGVAPAARDGMLGTPPIGFGGALDADRLRVYEHHDYVDRESGSPAAFPEGDDGLRQPRARRLLEQLRSEAYLAQGVSHCRRLVAGHSFRLADHPLARLNGDYVITHVEHEGRAPEWFPEHGADQVFVSKFQCAPRSVVVRPPPPPLRTRQVSETATVSGPPGEEIFTDQHGRIKVRFHWDLDDPKNDATSCWMRVMQPWAGARWGHQFIPRVGMEVVVTFLGGDPDRPLVTGCVSNGSHPPSFPLPESRTRSGVRTHSTPSAPGQLGFNELSFEDAVGKEQVYLRAERDLVEEVQNDHRTTVDGNQRTTVKGLQHATVEQHRSDEVLGNERRRVAGNAISAVEGDREDQVTGQLTTKVQGAARHHFKENRITHIDGRDRYEAEDEVDVALESHGFVRVRGCLTTLVGRPEARTSSALYVEGVSHSYSTGPTVLESEEGVVLKCGDSSLRMTAQSIELAAPSVFVRGGATHVAADELRLNAKDMLSSRSGSLVLATSGASLGLTDSTAKLCGASVQLGTSPEAAEEVRAADPIKPTNIELLDQRGKGVAHARFLVELEDGAQISGVTDAEGKASLELSGAAEVLFPDFNIDRA